jgi:hypothetical protein
MVDGKEIIDRKASHRLAVYREIIVTEHAFLRDMTTMLRAYYEPMIEGIESQSSPPVTELHVMQVITL